MMEHFQSLAGAGHDLRIDVSMDDAKRFTRDEFAQFLNRCQAQLGTEGGTDYFDLEDGPRKAVNAFERAHPGVTLETIRRECLAQWTPCPARMITGRHAEAAGTRTVQVLFDGEYNGYFKPDVHYIALRKDFSNSGEVLEKLADAPYCDRIADAAYETALSELTYARFIDRFHEALIGVL